MPVVFAVSSTFKDSEIAVAAKRFGTTKFASDPIRAQHGRAQRKAVSGANGFMRMIMKMLKTIGVKHIDFAKVNEVAVLKPLVEPQLTAIASDKKIAPGEEQAKLPSFRIGVSGQRQVLFVKSMAFQKFLADKVPNAEPFRKAFEKTNESTVKSFIEHEGSLAAGAVCGHAHTHTHTW